MKNTITIWICSELPGASDDALLRSIAHAAAQHKQNSEQSRPIYLRIAAVRVQILVHVRWILLDLKAHLSAGTIVHKLLDYMIVQR